MLAGKPITHKQASKPVQLRHEEVESETLGFSVVLDLVYNRQDKTPYVIVGVGGEKQRKACWLNAAQLQATIIKFHQMHAQMSRAESLVKSLDVVGNVTLPEM